MIPFHKAWPRIVLAAFLTLCLVALSQQPRAQFNGCSAGFCGGVATGFTPSCTASTNFLARATGVTLTVDKQNYDNLLCGLNTDGVLSSLDGLYIFVAPDTTTAKLNLVSSSFSPLTQTGSLTFAAYTGYTGDASTGFLDIGAVSSLVQFTQNSSSAGGCVLSSRTSAQNWAEFGEFVINDDLRFLPISGAGGPLIYATTGTVHTGIANSNVQGSWVLSRTTAITSSIYQNKIAFGGSPFIDTSGSIGSAHVYIFAENSGSPSNFTGDKIASFFIGGAQSSVNEAKLEARIDTYMVAYGINVCH